MSTSDELRGRKKSWLIWLALGLLVVLAAVALRQWSVHQYNKRLLASFPDEVVKDADLVAYAGELAKPAYAANCAACHGADLQGDSRLGAPNLKDQDWLYDEGSVSQIEQLILYGIRSGHGKTRSLAVMPAYGQPVPSKSYAVPPMTPQQIRDVVQFLLRQGGKPHDVTAAERGHKLYIDQGGCWDCHSEDARGNSAVGAPNLVDDIWLYGQGTPDDIYQSIANGHAGICPAWVTHLSPLTIRALAVYIHERSQSGSQSPQGSSKP